MKFFEEPIVGELTSSKAITRFSGNPVLKAQDVPYRTDLVLNAGVAKYQGKYVMLFRNDIRLDEFTVSEGVHLGLATSDDGLHWTPRPKPCFDIHNEEILNSYDPRITVMDGRCYITLGIDTRHGVRGGIVVTDDFQKFEVVSISAPENRNFVLFEKRFNGNYFRLERPFPIYGRPGYPERFDIWISDSPDLVHWGNSELLLGVEHVPFANQKVGAGPPPIKTSAGWLTIFHASDFDETRQRRGYEKSWKKRYCAGIMLLDNDDPRKIVAMSKRPLIAPEAPYETANGYRNFVVFPTGIILEDSGEVKIYYGAADTCMCLATADVADLINLCDSPP
ncbi:MAG: glycoside hydrolase family 130 protein [Bacteroidetes bacterium]|nr:glycoside hydrolase family 130 protein [Bacteroidota bacterium]